MLHEYVVGPILDHLDSETWHHRAVEALHFAEQTACRRALLRLFSRPCVDERLHVTMAGVEFANPVMVGAGWDKQGRAVRALHEAGFAGVDVGSVLRDPQEGNAKPRAFMIGPGVSLNRYGFNSEGIKGVGNHMEAYRDEDDLRMGINIGLNKTVMQTSPQSAPEAYASVASVLLPFASMITVNPSSPNTPGLRALQDRGPLTDIVQAVVGTVRSARSNVPIGVKVSADLSLTALDEVVDVAQQHGAQFLVAANTTTRPDLKRKYGERWENEPGGLSGNDPEFRMMSTEMIKHIHRTTLGRMAVIGVGGVHDTQTAMEKIWAGAGLVQVVTGVREKGIGVAGQINRGILRWMRRTGVSSLEQIRGLDAAR